MVIVGLDVGLREVGLKVFVGVRVVGLDVGLCVVGLEVVGILVGLNLGLEVGFKNIIIVNKEEGEGMVHKKWKSPFFFDAHHRHLLNLNQCQSRKFCRDDHPRLAGILPSNGQVVFATTLLHEGLSKRRKRKEIRTFI